MADGLVGAAVAVLELAGLGTGGQSGQLVAQTDAEVGMPVSSISRMLAMISTFSAGSPGPLESISVGIQRSQLGGGGGAGQNGHAAAALLQAAHDVVLAAQIEQGNMQRGVAAGTGCGRLIGLGLAAGDGLDGVDDRVGGDLRQKRRLLLRLGIGVELSRDGTVHDAALAQGAGQAAGVDASMPMMPFFFRKESSVSSLRKLEGFLHASRTI